MMAITHSVASVALGVLALQDTSSATVFLLIAGSQLPDIDNTQSSVGRLLWPLARWIELRFPHRGVTHSLLMTIGLALVSFGLSLKFGGFNWLALPLGHFVAICTDTLTPEGVQLFWPSPIWAVCGSNPNARIRTGSKAELGFLAICALLCAFAVWSADTGGIKLIFNQVLGIREGVIETLQKNASDKHIYLDLEGTFTVDRRPVKSRFWILEQVDKEFIIVDKSGIYKTGLLGQINVSKFVPVVSDEKVNIEVKSILFNEDEINSKLSLLLIPGKLIFLSGNLTIDSPDEVIVGNDPRQLNTLIVSGNQVILESCPIQLAMSKLNYQFAQGSLIAKIINPPPKL